MAILEMSVIGSSGDTKITWDSNNPQEVENARRTYDSLKQQGFSAFAVGKGKTRLGSMDTFDPTAERLIMAPGIVGG